MFIVYAGADPVVSSKNKNKAIAKAKAIYPYRPMVCVLRDMNTGEDSGLFYINPDTRR